MSEVLYMDDNLIIKFKPTSQLYPYVFVTLEDDDKECCTANCDYLDPEKLEEIGKSFLIASKKLREKLSNE